MPIDSLPLLSRAKPSDRPSCWGVHWRAKSPVRGSSTFTTRAPKSRSIRPAVGAAYMVPSSRTVTPARGGVPAGSLLMLWCLPWSSRPPLHVLRLEVLADAPPPHLPADAGEAEAAEGRVGAHVAATVDPHRAGAQPGG